MIHTIINPNLDEGQSGDPKALELANLRAKIRKLIEGHGGHPDWTKAHNMGQAQASTMCAQTIINFAYGKTKRPSIWTIKKLSLVVGYEIMAVPLGTTVEGAIRIE